MRSETAYELLKKRIMSNELAAGAEVDEMALAAELNISRTPVREAILRLSGEGFLEVQPRRGIRVIPISVTDMREMYDLITAIEIFAVWTLALQKPSREQLAILTELNKQMRTALDAGDLTAWTTADESFHRELLNLGGNKRAAEVGFALRDRVYRAHAVALRLRPLPYKSVEMHEELVDTIAEGRAEDARAMHLEQRIRAGEELISLIDRAGLRQL
jgi:DNA-binding GntR family transcriptional regulator